MLCRKIKRFHTNCSERVFHALSRELQEESCWNAMPSGTSDGAPDPRSHTLADVRWAQLRPSIFLLETRQSSHANLFKMMVPKGTAGGKKTATLALLLGTLETRQRKGGLSRNVLCDDPNIGAKPARSGEVLGPCVSSPARARDPPGQDVCTSSIHCSRCRALLLSFSSSAFTSKPQEPCLRTSTLFGWRLDEANRVVPALFNFVSRS